MKKINHYFQTTGSAVKLSVLLGVSLCLPLLSGCETSVHPQESSSAPHSSIVEDNSSDELSLLRTRMDSDGFLAGICYLGYYEGSPFDDSFAALPSVQDQLKKYPFIEDISGEHFAQNDGCEVYCLVPADPKSTVEVVSWDMETSTSGDTLYCGSGEPFLVRGNISDILPNLAVTISDSSGNVLTDFQPFMSLRDGKVGIPDDVSKSVLDLTDYSSILG